ncbi:fructosamine kinase family protein [Saprospiraceae bacterium]|nr:fructosamine kinase family protein [Saprospiraceae bacterium]
MDDIIQAKIESSINDKIISSELLGGGDSSFAFKIDTTSESYFCKYLQNDSASSNIQSEVNSLEILRKTNTCHIPEIVSTFAEGETSGLILQWIERKIANPENLENFGRKLAELHLNQADTFGWERDNFISILPQRNTKHFSWQNFYLSERIIPMLEQGINKGIFPAQVASKITRLEQRLIDEIPTEKPSLLHGDLWSGNYIIDREGNPYIIDPACYFGFREMDLAMSLMFGSFSRPFYVAYQEIFPMEKGFEDRLDLLQLYPLLVHSILFGGTYVGKVKSILEKS